jgi:hypothetical protein
MAMSLISSTSTLSTGLAPIFLSTLGLETCARDVNGSLLPFGSYTYTSFSTFGSSFWTAAGAAAATAGFWATGFVAGTTFSLHPTLTIDISMKK